MSLNARTKTDGVLGGSTTAIPTSVENRVDPGVRNPFLINAYTTVDLRAGYNFPNDHWKVLLFAKNLFNKYYWNNVIVTSDSVSRVAGMPTTYGATLSYKF